MALKLFDPQASRAVLIGSRVPAASQTVRELGGLITDEMRWGLAPKDCIEVVDSTTAQELRLALESANTGVRKGGLLLVYYAGRWDFDSDHQLTLVLAETDDPGHSSIRYDQVRWFVRQNAAEWRLVILDGRYPGPADDAALRARELSQRAGIEHASVLVSASPLDPAAPAGGDTPPFVAELISLLTDGLFPGPSLIDVQTLGMHLNRRLTDAGHAGLETHGTEETRTIPLVRNPALFRPERVGRIVLAAPFVTDPELERAVVLILRYHRDTGAVGVMLNRPGETFARDAAPEWAEFVNAPAVVFQGGPARHAGYIPLVSLRTGVPAPLRFRPVAGRLGTLPLSAEVSSLRHAVEELRLFSGYLGWQPGELEAEFASGVLIPTDESADVAFSAPKQLWQRLLRPKTDPTIESRQG